MCVCICKYIIDSATILLTHSLASNNCCSAAVFLALWCCSSISYVS